MHLEQEMQPAHAPPPPFKRFFRKAMLSKAAQMLVQLQVRPAAVPTCNFLAPSRHLTPPQRQSCSALHCIAVMITEVLS